MTGPSPTGSYLWVAPAVYDIGQAFTLDSHKGHSNPENATMRTVIRLVEQEDPPSLNYSLKLPNESEKDNKKNILDNRMFDGEIDHEETSREMKSGGTGSLNVRN